MKRRSVSVRRNANSANSSHGRVTAAAQSPREVRDKVRTHYGMAEVAEVLATLLIAG